MSDTIKIGSTEFELTIVTQKRHTRKKDAEGKNTTVEIDHQIVSPILGSAADAIKLFTAIVEAAEAKESGNGLKLAQAILLPRIESASEASFDFEKNTEDPPKYVEVMITPERPRSTGATMESLNSELADLTPEFLMLSAVARQAEGWKTLVDSVGAKLFVTQDEYLLRLVAIQNRLGQIVRTREEKVRKSAELKAKRAESAKAAAAVAAAAAAAKV